MLEPRDRQLFLESLRPPQGYALDHAVGATFTLDLLALMAAPLAFTFFDASGGEGTADPLLILESVRRNSDRVHVFCQATQIAVPPRNRPLVAYLESSVIEVRAPRGGLFHPKLWLLRFVPQAEREGLVRYRLLVLSRNLTFDRSWDVVVALDGELTERKNAIAANRPLSDLIRALPSMAVRGVSSALQAVIDRMHEEVLRVRFEPPPDIDTVAFWPIGLSQPSPWPFKTRIDRLLVVSPFVSDNCLRRFLEISSDNVLVSRSESLDAMPTALLKGFKRLHVISDAASPEDTDESEAGEETAPNESPTENALVGLHAKLYVADAGWDAHVWLGSANATDAGFDNNVELLVELRGKKSKCGVEAVLGGESGATLRSLLRSYEPPPTPTVDPIEEGLRAAVESTREAIGNADLRLRVAPTSPDRSTLTLQSSGEAGLVLSDRVSVRCWPATLGEGVAGAALAPFPPGAGDLAAFDQLSLPELTSFMAFHVVAEHEGRTKEERFALNLPLENAPPERREALLKALLKNRDALLRYLLFLLAESGGVAGPGLELVGLVASTGDSAGAGDGGIPLFEALLQTLHREPSKLDHVERLVADLSRTPDGRELLPEGFDRIWGPIQAVRKELASR